MKNAFEFKTLTEFTDYFRDEETCVRHFTAIRFRNGEYCPHCGHTKIHLFSSGKRYRCAACKQDFTIRTNTVFGESKLPLRKWFMAIYLLSNTSKGISSVQLAKHVGVTQKTGWFMDHRIRKAMKQNNGQLFGGVEADETYVGGKAYNMHAAKRKEVIGDRRGGSGKIVVHGMLERGLKGAKASRVKAAVVPDAQKATLKPLLEAGIAPGSKLYTDTAMQYVKMGAIGFDHEMVDHALTYVNGNCHTNSLESFWALFKRGYHGIYHQMSRKHLPRYLDEFCFRFNRKSEEMQTVFSDVVLQVTESTKLPYKELTA